MADFGLSKIFQPSIYKQHSETDYNTIAANENGGVLMENCSLGDNIGGNTTSTGCNTSYHGSLLARSESIGKKYALKKYDQFALNTSCFWGSTRSKISPSCAISPNFCYKNND